MTDSTPCTEWNVGQLVEHVVGGAGYASVALAGAHPQPSDPSQSAVDAYDANVGKTLEACGQAGAMEKLVQSPMGEIPGGQLMAGLFMDQLIHGWDLAKATGQDTAMPAQLVEVCYQMFAPNIDMLRQSGEFGPEVSVSSDASVQDKLISLTGRQP